MFVSHGLGSLVVLLERLGEPLAAATLNGPLTTAIDSNPFVPELADAVRRAREKLGDATFDEASRSGRSMPLYELQAYAAEQVQAALVGLGGRMER